jgi:hypothetical protein
MKKRKVITAVLLVAFLLMGASYAAWSDTLILDHNVTTGTLDVDWQPNYSGYEYPFVTINDIDGVLDPTCTMVVDYPVDDTMSIVINNMYPGVFAYFDIHQQNMGTLPAKFGGVAVDTTGSTPGALTNIVYSFSLWIYENDLGWDYIDFYEGTVGGVEAFLNANLAGKVLDPADHIATFEGDIAEEYLGRLSLPITAGDDAQGQFLNFDITFTWLQP